MLKSFSKKHNILNIIIMMFIAWFVVTFLIYPNVTVLTKGLFTESGFTMEPIHKLLNSKRALSSLRNSFILAITLSVTVNIVGIFTVLVTNYFDVKGSKLLTLAYKTPLIYGGVVLVSAFRVMYGDTGLITKFLVNTINLSNPNWFIGFPAVVFIMSFASTQNHILFLESSLQQVDYQTIEASQNLGANQWTVLKKVVLPTLTPTLISLTILTFLTGLTATSAPLLVGGDKFQTITPMILRFSRSQSSQDLSIILAIALGISTVILLTLLMKFEKKGNFVSVSKVVTPIKKQKIKNKYVNVLVHIIAYVIFLIYLIPIIMIILYSFTNGHTITTGNFKLSSLTLANYKNLFVMKDALLPYIVSIIYAVLASLIVGIFALVVARIVKRSKGKLGQLLEYSLMIPWMLPSTLIAMGLIISFNKPSNLLLGKTLSGTLIMLLIGYIITKIPFTYRLSKSSLYSVNEEVEDAAKILGASNSMILRKIIMPIIFPTLQGIFALNFISIISDYDLTVFLYHPVYQPLGIVMKNATDPNSLGDAKAMSFVYTVVLMIVSIIVLYLTKGEKYKDVG